jgi:hypothetical protein
MILLIAGATLGVLVARAAIRQRRTDREVASRLVRRAPGEYEAIAEGWAEHNARLRAIMDKIRDDSYTADEARSVAYWAKIKRASLAWEANKQRVYG